MEYFPPVRIFRCFRMRTWCLYPYKRIRKVLEPDYGPMFGALEKLAEALSKKPLPKIPLIIFESTLAPTTMDTLFREHFKKYGLEEGKDILLGN